MSYIHIRERIVGAITMAIAVFWVISNPIL